MSLSVTYGAFTDLEAALIERLREWSAKQRKASGELPSLAIVAPSRRLVDRLERLLAVEAGLPLINVHFHTFFSLAGAVIEEAGPPPDALVTDAGFHQKTLEVLLEENSALAAPFGAPHQLRALSAALYPSLKDLIDAGVSSDWLKEHSAAELLKSPEEGARLSALLKLAAAYQERLKTLGLLSSSDWTALAVKLAGDSADLNKFDEIVYYGFYDLTGLQLEFFEAVTDNRPAALYFPYLKGHPSFRFADGFFEEKLSKFDPQPAPPRKNRPVLESAFTPVESASLDSSKRLKIFSASGERDEVWATAKEILRLVEEEGVDYSEIGVIARSLDGYGEAISEIFGENAIPFDCEDSAPLLSRPLAKQAVNLLSLKDQDYPAASVEDLISSPYFKPGEISFSAEMPALWRRRIRESAIHSGWAQWKRLSGLKGEGIESLWAWIKRAADAIGSAEKKKTWSDLVQHARDMIQTNLSLPTEPSIEETEILRLIGEALDSLAEFDRLEAPASWTDFIEALTKKLGRPADLTAGQRPHEGVRVLDAMGGRGESFRVLFLIGLRENLFPRQILEDPFLREEARQALRNAAGFWISTKLRGYEEERLLFFLSATSASETLYALYPRSNEDGAAQVSSLYLRELAQAAGLGTLDSGSSVSVPREPFQKIIFCAPERLTPHEALLALCLERNKGGRRAKTADADPVRFEPGARGEILALGLERSDLLRAWSTPGPWDGLAGEPAEYLRELKVSGISASALDRFAQCPFQFFSERVLGFGNPEAASSKDEISPLLKGSIYHEILEAFYASIDDPFWKNPKAPHEPSLHRAIEEVFKRHGHETLGIYPLLWLSVKKTMTKNLERFAAEDVSELRRTGFRPQWLEKELSTDFPGPLPRSLQGLALHGIIDRLDFNAELKRYRIIDYKTKKPGSIKGKTSWFPKKTQGRRSNHQLPFYAELAARNFPSGTLEGAFLYLLERPTGAKDDDSVLGFGLEDWESQREAFFKDAGAELSEIAAGRFPIRPEDGAYGYCRWCRFSSVCRKSHGPSRARAATLTEGDKEESEKGGK